MCRGHGTLQDSGTTSPTFDFLPKPAKDPAKLGCWWRKTCFTLSCPFVIRWLKWGHTDFPPSFVLFIFFHPKTRLSNITNTTSSPKPSKAPLFRAKKTPLTSLILGFASCALSGASSRRPGDPGLGAAGVAHRHLARRSRHWMLHLNPVYSRLIRLKSCDGSIGVCWERTLPLWVPKEKGQRPVGSVFSSNCISHSLPMAPDLVDLKWWTPLVIWARS